MLSIFKNSLQIFGAIKTRHLTGAYLLSFKGCYLLAS